MDRNAMMFFNAVLPSLTGPITTQAHNARLTGRAELPQKPKPTSRDAIYNRLRSEFKAIEDELSPEKQTELDGLLWKIAAEISE